MPREDARPGADVGRPQTPGSLAGSAPPVLNDDEKNVLNALVKCSASQTAGQLSASCGLTREQVAIALESLRAKGLVTRHNTLVESYASRFPGVEVT